MATMKKSLRYGAAAMVMALAIIGTTLYANSIWAPRSVKGQTNFLVMLTDPPNVPEGTTKLEVTYSGIQLHVVASDGTANWIASEASGKVDLLSLVNVKQTIASLSIPTGSTVDRLKFTISSAEATIGGTVYPVKILSEQLVVSLKGTKLDGTTTGALIDLRPTLMRIKATDADGAVVNYYVLVPSASAVIKSNVDEKHSKVGAQSQLDDEDNQELEEENDRVSGNVVITDSTLSVSGDETTFKVTLKNEGKEDASVSGLTVHGHFVSTSSTTIRVDEGNEGDDNENDHHDDLFFKISVGTLTPILGNEDHHGNGETSKLVLKPDESVSLTFKGVIKLQPDSHKAALVSLTPIKGDKYRVRLAGEDSPSFEVTAS
jgi:hypothetical protein